jgi:general secretion pathway protein H
MTSRFSLPRGKTAPARCRASEIGGKRHRRANGFTLIELLVVLAIVGMAIAVAAPILFGHSTGATLGAAAGEIRAALRGARSTAIEESRRVVFQGDPGGGYWLDRNHFTLPLMSGAQPVRVATLGGAQISFYPSGGSSGGRIVVTSGAGQREIAVDMLTGRADAR